MKTCFRCSQAKPLAEFYRHPRMADGRLGKCIECTKMDVKENRRAKIDHYREKDRVRASEPEAYERRRRYSKTEDGRAAKARAHATERVRHADKIKARTALSNAIRDGKIKRPEACWACGSMDRVHGHHPDYSNHLGVSWLCHSCHADAHRVTKEYIREQKTNHYRSSP